MPYSKDYFALQLAFAQKVAEIEQQPLVEVLLNYTSFYKTFRIDDWKFDRISFFDDDNLLPYFFCCID